MYVKRVLIHYRGLASIGLVPCVMVSRSIVVHWDGSWSESHPWTAQEEHYLSPHHVSAHCTLSYPSLPYPDLSGPAVLSSSICVSVFPPDLTYLSPFVSLLL
jgi:hypothetical protein